MGHPYQRNRNLPADTPLIREVWRRYRAAGHPDDLERITRHYLRLLDFHAAQVRRRVERGVSFDDLRSAGAVALLGQIRAFDPDRPGSFTAYSWKHIRWAMWEEAELLTGGPVSRRKRGAAERVRSEVLQQLGRPPSPAEYAAHGAACRYWRTSFGQPVSGFWLTEDDERPLLPPPSTLPDRPARPPGRPRRAARRAEGPDARHVAGGASDVRGVLPPRADVPGDRGGPGRGAPRRLGRIPPGHGAPEGGP